MAKLIGIGVGPGDPELLTLKAIKALKEIDILLLPTGRAGGESEAYGIACSYIPEQVTLIKRHFPMTSNTVEMLDAIQEIAEEIIPMIQSGKTIGFITLGDPMLYSTYGYLKKFVELECEVATIPGIMSFGAIASGTNHILCEGDTPLVVYPCTDDLARLDALLASGSALVLMKVFRQFERVKAKLIANGLADSCVIASNYGKPNEMLYRSLEDVNPENLSYFTTILVNPKA
jgi:sirohydrochlorin cobaltochelatase